MDLKALYPNRKGRTWWSQEKLDREMVETFIPLDIHAEEVRSILDDPEPIELKLASLVSSYRNQRESIRKLQAERKALQCSLDGAQEKVMYLEHWNEVLCGQVAEANAAFSKERAKRASPDDARRAVLEIKLKDAGDTIARLTTSQTSVLNRAKQAEETLDAERKNWERQAEAYRSDLLQARKMAGEPCKACQDDLAKLRKERDDAWERMANLRKERDELNKSVAIQMDTVQRLSQERGEAWAQFEARQTKIDELCKQRNDLNDQLINSRSERYKLWGQIRSARELLARCLTLLPAGKLLEDIKDMFENP